MFSALRGPRRHAGASNKHTTGRRMKKIKYLSKKCESISIGRAIEEVRLTVKATTLVVVVVVVVVIIEITVCDIYPDK